MITDKCPCHQTYTRNVGQSTLLICATIRIIARHAWFVVIAVSTAQSDTSGSENGSFAQSVAQDISGITDIASVF
jgi:uncharacterized membrane protein